MRYRCQYTLNIVWRQQRIPVIDIDDVCEAATSYIERGRERDPIQSINHDQPINCPSNLSPYRPACHPYSDRSSLKPIRL